MWQCPKCGREFTNQDQNHFCSEAPNTIDAYIEAQAKQVQPLFTSGSEYNPNRIARCRGTYFVEDANILERT
ncbi:hypothetical protein [Lacrimispora xylanisolvens]|uniref:hypothetical protein n=1 Tax=Lacrimispora xylanisolvens TaxID=384636 RepID=UPI003D9CA22C